MSGGRPWLQKVHTDIELCRRTGLHPWDLLTARRWLYKRYRPLAIREREFLADGGTFRRFAFLNQEVLGKAWRAPPWELWLRYLGLRIDELDLMCRGEYPIDPWTIRLYTALFGMQMEFLMLGDPPAPAREPININMMPETSGKWGR